MTQLETDKIKTLTTTVLRRAFREYYFNFAKKIEIPNRIKEREFGFARFDNEGMVRHLSFTNIGELIGTLVRETPSDVYCSNSYYRFPTLAMKEKQWLGADLIFDIDGKDLDLECVPSHSYYLCANCRKASSVMENSTHHCIHCKSEVVKEISIPCSKCIQASKKQVKHLMEILTEDFGINHNEINVYFSGNNGFHITIKNNEFVACDSPMRSEIINYILGKGLMPEVMGVRKDGLTNEAASRGFRIKFPKGTYSYAWRKRVAQEMDLRTNDPSEERLKHIVIEKGGYQGFKAEIDKITQKMGSLIDPNVTVDIHRVFRMPGTLNSKSGLAKIRCDNIETFNPFIDACLLGEQEINIISKISTDLKLKRKTIKVKEGHGSLPAYAAVYLICKGLADAA